MEHLFVYARSGDVAALTALLRSDDVNITDPDGRTLLSWAAAGGHAHVVRKLLDVGAHVDDGPPGNRITPLGYAVCGHHADVVCMLLSAGANPNAKDANGQTPLFHCHSMEVMRALHAHGALVDIVASSRSGVRDYGVLTAMANYGYVDQVRFLLQHGADPHAVDNFGRTALAFAIDKGHRAVALLLLDAGVKPSVSDLTLCAGMRGLGGVLAVLMQRARDINGVDDAGRVALDVALESNEAYNIELLLKGGATSRDPKVNIIADMYRTIRADYENLIQAFPNILAQQTRARD